MKNEWTERAEMRAQIERLTQERDEMEKEYNGKLEEAYKMLIAEREKNNKLEVELYKDYDNKLAEMKKYIVDKVDQYLKIRWQELTEAAQNDPEAKKYTELLEAWKKAVPAAYMVEDAIVNPLPIRCTSMRTYT